MDVRAQVSMVFHLDKCIGCHTCSVSCKNVWTDRRGAEYMWWNNVESRPGTGYPTLWEDQEKYRGGWEKRGENLMLRLQGRLGSFANLFFNRSLPTLDDYYEPWTYRYADLFGAPPGDDQPTARPISQITGKPIDIEAGPNWDDDLGGSNIYAAGDPSLADLTEEERSQMFALERIFCFYLPRICNHCLNPACVASCPSGAIYKRGEDGVVLINQSVCRGWRMCVTACPYKKTYYNWSTGKSEKCILCYPRIEAGHAPACMHSCVGRIRYLGVLLYDADRIESVASAEEAELVGRQMDMILDPFDPEVIRAAQRTGVADSTIDAAQKSPTYKFVKEWDLALPLHPEFRTLPMLFYVPPLLPVMASVSAVDTSEQSKRMHPIGKHWPDSWLYDTSTEKLFGTIDDARFPLQYMANLFSAGDTAQVAARLKKLMAVRLHRRQITVGDVPDDTVKQALADTELTPRLADDIYYLTSLATFDDRFVIPAAHREQAVEMMEFTGDVRGSTGFGFKAGSAERGS